MSSALQQPSTVSEPTAILETKPRLLIVDDVADNRTILTRRFERRGFEVREADGGMSALALIDSEPFDMVLLDVMMPEIDGLEVLKRIRLRFSPVELPVIMVTAKSQSEDIVGALELQANDYVTKPVDFAIALARVTIQLDRKRVSDALRVANERLEERVEERTMELMQINRKLEGEIVQRQRSEAATRYMALHDALTGLANRVLFRDRLAEALDQSAVQNGGIAILFIDLDGFKSVNDTLGHSIGDMLLKSVAADFQALMGEHDLIARLGGDEFAILHHCDEALSGVIQIAEKIIAAAARQRTIEGHAVTVGASVGIVTSFEQGEEPENLLKNADLAMYRAKADGRGTYRIFNPEMDAKAQARRLLELDMRTAFVNGQYEVFYQPLISMEHHRVAGFEALMRWNHPERGPVSPGEFIPIAEETGMIVQLGDWVLREACRQAVRWPDHVRIAVNVSTVQFVRGNVVASVMGALAQSGLPAHRLEVEITESVLLEKTEQNIEILEQLRALGVRIAMDDFGTGYSSLGYLRRFRFDKIKIDQSFIRDIAKDVESSAIVNAITRLGVSFGISTTAEGVETQEQLLRLAAEGCHEVQGWLFSKAISASEVLDILQLPEGTIVEECRRRLTA
ncbi:diguanylate cyclase (GGDEF) domain-containing protein [Rhizobium sp. RU20A]|uniref:putative bifunctional diguanylate cyclase/phosphodiesterase n=1 Tax=Rhizobium sp. RU20A TaxID=1907412 RepID=UPI0009543BEE|nr:EAL domain-containing protein [Rhizobium sp. RU20A]SIR32224.1 diguanylate cyclase (GGDEF) domain-containing protein [Rhizobium sp. RU20A]